MTWRYHPSTPSLRQQVLAEFNTCRTPTGAVAQTHDGRPRRDYRRDSGPAERGMTRRGAIVVWTAPE